MECPDCGYLNAVKNSHCSNCGEGLPEADGTAPPPIAPATAFDPQRPTGTAAIAVALIMGMLGASFWVFGALQESTTYSYAGREPNEAKIVLTWMGAGMVQIAILLGAVGYIVKAISFLPGKGD